MSNYQYLVVIIDNEVEVQVLHTFPKLTQAKRYAERMKSRFMHPGVNQYLVIYKYEKLEKCTKYKLRLDSTARAGYYITPKTARIFL